MNVGAIKKEKRKKVRQSQVTVGSMSMRIIKSKNQCKELVSMCPSGSNKETEPRGGFGEREREVCR